MEARLAMARKRTALALANAAQFVMTNALHWAHDHGGSQASRPPITLAIPSGAAGVFSFLEPTGMDNSFLNRLKT